MSFPTTRLRRLRQNEQLRSLVRQTRLSPEAFVYPLFVCPGEGVRKEVRSMPGVFNFSIDEAMKEAREARSEERRVGKECRSRGWPEDERKKRREKAGSVTQIEG